MEERLEINAAGTLVESWMLILSFLSLPAIDSRIFSTWRSIVQLRVGMEWDASYMHNNSIQFN